MQRLASWNIRKICRSSERIWRTVVIRMGNIAPSDNQLNNGKMTNHCLWKMFLNLKIKLNLGSSIFVEWILNTMSILETYDHVKVTAYITWQSCRCSKFIFLCLKQKNLPAPLPTFQWTLTFCRLSIQHVHCNMPIYLLHSQWTLNFYFLGIFNRYMEACPSEGQQAYDFANQPGAGIVSHFTQVCFNALF